MAGGGMDDAKGSAASLLKNLEQPKWVQTKNVQCASGNWNFHHFERKERWLATRTVWPVLLIL